MVTRDPGASFDTPNVVIGRQGRNELTLSFRPDPYLARLLDCSVCPCLESQLQWLVIEIVSNNAAAVAYGVPGMKSYCQHKHLCIA